MEVGIAKDYVNILLAGWQRKRGRAGKHPVHAETCLGHLAELGKAALAARVVPYVETGTQHPDHMWELIVVNDMFGQE